MGLSTNSHKCGSTLACPNNTRLRWSGILAAAAQRAFAASFLELPPGHEGSAGGPDPPLHELLADARWQVTPLRHAGRERRCTSFPSPRENSREEKSIERKERKIRIFEACVGFHLVYCLHTVWWNRAALRKLAYVSRIFYLKVLRLAACKAYSNICCTGNCIWFIELLYSPPLTSCERVFSTRVVVVFFHVRTWGSRQTEMQGTTETGWLYRWLVARKSWQIFDRLRESRGGTKSVPF